MRKIAANYIFTLIGPPLKNGIVLIDDQGVILEVIDTKGSLREEAGLEFYNGIITPGFINAHCHLELSHMLGAIPRHTGLENFLYQVNNNRHFESQEIKSAIESAHKEMYKNGIVAVADICNTSDSFDIKSKNEIQYHSFIEVFGLDSSQVPELINEAISLSRQIDQRVPHPWSIVPHAPYTMSHDLFQKVSELVTGRIATIHNQECEGELQLFKSRTGPLFDFLATFGTHIQDFRPSSTNSLEHSLNYLRKANKILLVHNTYSSKEDVQLALEINPAVYWVLCPNANLYIEDHLPDMNLLMSLENLALGTDSLASNDFLSIFEEMKTLLLNFKELKFEEVLKWGTLNGAKALNMQSRLGSIEKGKKPGLNLITGMDLLEIRMKQNAKIQRLV